MKIALFAILGFFGGIVVSWLIGFALDLNLDVGINLIVISALMGCVTGIIVAIRKKKEQSALKLHTPT